MAMLAMLMAQLMTSAEFGCIFFEKQYNCDEYKG
jgi:hypothetical protein